MEAAARGAEDRRECGRKRRRAGERAVRQEPEEAKKNKSDEETEKEMR